ncbi:MAG: hypothetical protein FJW26_19985 [Acidimicrobiia bacterium]|nr:hypothetical protein [Acidimicrobiia bacterium]
MLAKLPYDKIKRYTPPSDSDRTAVCLGDQKPGFGSGYETIGGMFQGLGYAKCLTLDYNGEADIYHNLNLPLPRSNWGIADVVFDGGTSEHVANIGESLTTIVRLMKVGGLLVQGVPLNCYGGSYYGLDPLLLHDFYRANGFEQKELLIMDNTNWRIAMMRWACRNLPVGLVEAVRLRLQKTTKTKALILQEPPVRLYEAAPAHAFEGRFNNVPIFRKVPTTAHVLYVGVKRKEVGDITWPAQRDYPDKA